MPDDIVGTLERLAPHLAWPLIALIALPLIAWRLSAVSKLYEIFYSDDGKNLASTIFDANERLDSIKKKLEEISAQSKGLSDYLKQIDEASIVTADKQIEEIAGVVADEVAEEGPERLDIEEMFQGLADAWEGLRNAVRAKFDELELREDLRSIGTVVSKLGDKRRRNYLGQDDVRLISTLHTQYKRFVRLKSSREDWLTPDVYRNFVSAARSLVPKVQAVGQA